MNPARSLAPALVAWRLDSLWLYLTAPVLGAGIGVLACRCVQAPGCCVENSNRSQLVAPPKEACP